MSAALYDPWSACLEYLATYCDQHKDAIQPEVNRRYAAVLWLFADCIAAKTILEIGVGPTSVSGCTFILNMAQRGGGHLVSVDIDTERPRPVYRELAAQQGVGWTVIYGDSLTMDAAAVIPLQPNSVDLLYIDGDHDAAHAESDLKKFLPYLRPGGYLLIDDFPPQKGVGEGRAVIDQIIPEHMHIAHSAPHGNGRLVWQKPLDRTPWEGSR